MDFSQVKGLTIPEGEVKKITIGGQVVWELADKMIPLQYGNTNYLTLIIDGVRYTKNFPTSISPSSVVTVQTRALGSQDFTRVFFKTLDLRRVPYPNSSSNVHGKSFGIPAEYYQIPTLTSIKFSSSIYRNQQSVDIDLSERPLE